MPDFNKFEQRFPSHQNAVDILAGHWDADLSFAVPGLTAGTKPLFTTDTRPQVAAARLGTDGKFTGMRILELGPLEGAHTFVLEKLGAEAILAIEANVEAFLKCLIVKEVCDLKRARFMLGDFVQYLNQTMDRFDLVFCSGVLYHLSDPVSVIRSIAGVTRKCFVWTHYFDPEHYIGPPRDTIVKDGFTLYQLEYGDMHNPNFWGGNKPIASWMTKEHVLRAFCEAGFAAIDIVEDSPEHPNGAAFTFTARMPG